MRIWAGLLIVSWIVFACSKTDTSTRQASRLPQTHKDSVELSEDYFERGYSEYLPGHYDSSLKLTSLAIAFNPGNAQAWHTRASCLSHLDSFFESRAAYDSAIKLKPDYRQAWWHRGCLHAATGAVDSALADLQHAIAIDSNVKRWPFDDDCWKPLRNHPKLLAITGPPPER